LARILSLFEGALFLQPLRLEICLLPRTDNARKKKYVWIFLHRFTIVWGTEQNVGGTQPWVSYSIQGSGNILIGLNNSKKQSVVLMLCE